MFDIEDPHNYVLEKENFKIPEFMKNDLKHLQKEGEGDQEIELDDTVNVTIQGRIRKSTYYVIARAIKFGLDPKYLIEKCKLT